MFRRKRDWYAHCTFLGVPKSGDQNNQFGIYKSTCCGAEIVLVQGAVFPLCHKHKLPAGWKIVTAIDPGDLRQKDKKAA
ncbi:MAG TPA: hypothetical protein VE422_03680 [Terriglobia bacterium]|nr:hypothetical protein [Terriglobia bacterium]